LTDQFPAFTESFRAPAFLRLPGQWRPPTFDSTKRVNIMKTLNIFTTALIITLSLNAFADGKPGNKTPGNTKENRTWISFPEQEWGNPADAVSASVEELKLKSPLLVKAPEMIWGNPEELNIEALESLKNAPLVAAPEMTWGDPADLYSFELLK
jgi:hypothetical protein